MAFRSPSRRALSLACMVAIAALGAAGCAADEADNANANVSEEGPATDDITNVQNSKVKRQSIGNCWLYATASWYEGLHKGLQGNVESNTSESWLTYWHWFEQLANGEASDAISTGGAYGTAVDLITRYGLVNEGDFIPNEASAEMSATQKSALEAMNTSLKSGVLSRPEARRDRATIRKELDKAWKLDAGRVARINKVFGASVERTLDRSSSASNAAKANGIIRAQDYAVRLKAAGGAVTTGTLADAIGKSGGFFGPRTGKFAFNEVTYPSTPSGRREFWKRVQSALHDEFPIITSWKIDFNALTRDSRFSLEELKKRGPGSQGGHMTVMVDYQAQVPGLGLLEAGKPATAAQMTAALADGTKIEFVRVKNSWGGLRPDRWDTAAVAGFHDMEMGYLDGPITDCPEGADGKTDTTKCEGSSTPLWDVVLPAGY